MAVTHLRKPTLAAAAASSSDGSDTPLPDEATHQVCCSIKSAWMHFKCGQHDLLTLGIDPSLVCHHQECGVVLVLLNMPSAPNFCTIATHSAVVISIVVQSHDALRFCQLITTQSDKGCSNALTECQNLLKLLIADCLWLALPEHKLLQSYRA